ncbi:MAG: hypothetical protein QMB16_07880, partial [Paracoccaceae bacterium]
MIRIDARGGIRTFAALCLRDRCAGQSDLDEFDTQRPLFKSRRTSVRLSLRHAAVLGSPVAQATPSPRSIAL